MKTYENWYQFEQDVISDIENQAVFTIQLSVRGFSRSPYLQGSTDSEGNFMLELSSGNFVTPPYTDEQEGLLRGLGWRRPVDSNQPNFHKAIGTADARPLVLARQFRDALQVALGLNPKGVTRINQPTSPSLTANS